MTSAALLPLLALLATSPARVHGNESKLQAGQGELSRGNYDAALKDFDAALFEAQDPQTVVRIHLLRAQVFGAKQDYVQSEAALAQALEFDPEASLDPARVDPALVKTLESLRSRLTGELKVTTDPAVARIRLDGSEVGSAPFKTEVSIGRHTIEATTPDGKFAAKQQVVVRRTGTNVLVMMVATTAGATATAAPAEAPNVPAARADKTFVGFGEFRLDLNLNGTFNTPMGRTVIGAVGDNLPYTFGESVGGGFRSRFFRASLDVRFRPETGNGTADLGVDLRGALCIPLTERLDGYISVEVLNDFIQGGLDVGLGAALGIEWLGWNLLGLFSELGARHFFAFNQDDVMLQAGVRIWFP